MKQKTANCDPNHRNYEQLRKKQIFRKLLFKVASLGSYAIGWQKLDFSSCTSSGIAKFKSG
jgi:hypothetical protein